MSNFSSGYILTDAGSKLMADVNAGKLTLKLTKMQLGSGETDTVGDYETRSALIAPQNAMVITSITTEDVGDVRTCLLKASLTSESVEAGYEATELGIFAQDSSGQEILYGVCCDSTPGYVASKSDGNNVKMDFAVRIITTSKATVELVLPKTAEELVALAQQDAAKAIDSAAAAKASADKAAELNTYTQTAMSTASSYADKAKESASNASSSASTAEEASSSASSSASAAAASATSASTSATVASQNADRAADAASVASTAASSSSTAAATAQDCLTQIQEASDIAADTLKQAQALSTASAGIRYYRDDDGDLCYEMIN